MVLVNDLRWIDSFTVLTIHRTTKDLYKYKSTNFAEFDTGGGGGAGGTQLFLVGVCHTGFQK